MFSDLIKGGRACVSRNVGDKTIHRDLQLLVAIQNSRKSRAKFSNPQTLIERPRNNICISKSIGGNQVFRVGILYIVEMLGVEPRFKATVYKGNLFLIISFTYQSSPVDSIPHIVYTVCSMYQIQYVFFLKSVMYCYNVSRSVLASTGQIHRTRSASRDYRHFGNSELIKSPV